MSRTTDNPKSATKTSVKKGGSKTVVSKTAAKQLVKRVVQRSEVPRPPSLAVARMRMKAGRTFWADLTPEQRAAGLDGPEASGRGPKLSRSIEE